MVFDVTGESIASVPSLFPVDGNTGADIQAAINSAYNAGGGVVVLDANKTYTVSSQIVLYSDFVTLIGNGAKLDASANSGASAIWIKGGTKLAEEHEQIRQQYTHYMDGVYFIGPNRTMNYEGGRSGTCILCEGSSYTSISNGFLIKNCSIAGFQVGIEFHAHSWCNTLLNCDISVCDVAVKMPRGYSDYGEKITFLSGCLHTNSLAASNDNIYGTFQFIGTAFDYNFAAIECKNGQIYLANCHVENNKDKDYFFKVSGGVMLVRDSTFYAEQSTYGLASVSGGKLYLKENTKQKWSMAANSITGGTFDESWI